MSVSIANATPRELFQRENRHISPHRQLIQSIEFMIAADCAMLEYARSLADEGTMSIEGSAARGFRLQGAQEFLAIFKTLAEPPPVMQKTKDLDNLPNITAARRQ